MHSLHQIFTQGLDSCGWLCTPCTSLFVLLAKGRFFVISYYLWNRNRLCHTLLAFCEHTLHYVLRRETIEKYPHIHSLIYSYEVHSFTHENTNTMNCKQFSHHTLNQISFVLFISENDYNWNKKQQLKLQFPANLKLTSTLQSTSFGHTKPLYLRGILEFPH